MLSLLLHQSYVIQHGYCKNQLHNDLSYKSYPELVWGRLQPERPRHPIRLAL